MPLPNSGKYVTTAIDQAAVEAIAQLISDVGRPIDIHLIPSSIDCPNCGWDTVYKRSNNRYDSSNPNSLGPLNKPFATNARCPVCDRKGKLFTPSSTSIICAIIKNTEELQKFEVNKGLEHNSTSETYALSEDPNFNTFKNATTVNIDGQTFYRAS